MTTLEVDPENWTSRGDVVQVLFPNSNLRTAKRRPALVVQADNLGNRLVTVAKTQNQALQQTGRHDRFLGSSPAAAPLLSLGVRGLVALGGSP